MAKPDNRADNVEKLQTHVQNTIDRLEEAEEYLALHGDEIDETERRNIEVKNEHRRESIERFRNEIKDEARNQRRESSSGLGAGME